VAAGSGWETIIAGLAHPALDPRATYRCQLVTSGPAAPPPPAALRAGLVIHDTQVCWSGASRPWPPPGLPPEAHPPHGLVVICPACNAAGVCPQRGYELAFLPPGTTYDTARGTYTVPLGGAPT
jgi:hypothetical protein